MLLVFPFVELSEGSCTYCIIGEEGTEKFYREMSDNPLRLTQLWRRENAKTVHIADVDSFEGKNNIINFNSALYIAQSIDIPVQFFSNFDSVDECELFLESGIYRIAINRLAIIDPEGVRKLVSKYTPQRIVFVLISNNGYAHLPGMDIMVTDREFIKNIKELGGDRMVYGDISWLRHQEDASPERMKQIAKESGLKITMLEGASTPGQLWALNELVPYGVDSIILGKSLYENNYPCQKIWRLIEEKLEPDLIR
ncbi:MAG: HisA/HisF-related TIM barrel protein [Candidatus Kapaibacterium sp.]